MESYLNNRKMTKTFSYDKKANWIKHRKTIKIKIYFPDIKEKGIKSNFFYPYFFISFVMPSESKF